MFQEGEIDQKRDAMPRRFFWDTDISLFVWYDPRGTPWGFQLIYKLPGYPSMAVTWTPLEGWLHHLLVESRRPGQWPSTTGMRSTASAYFDKPRVLDLLKSAWRGLAPQERVFVFDKLVAHPNDMEVCGFCKDKRAASSFCAGCGLRACTACAHTPELRGAKCPKPHSSVPVHAWAHELPED